MVPIDIKADNIMFGIDDNDAVFAKFEQDELQNPCPRKVLPDRTIYTSRDLGMPRQVGAPVLCDFGSAVSGEMEHLEDVQPNVYRAPEVILEVPWTYDIDIWNVGCMVSLNQIDAVEETSSDACICRSGMSLRVDTCSQDTIRSSTPTAVELILRKW